MRIRDHRRWTSGWKKFSSDRFLRNMEAEKSFMLGKNTQEIQSDIDLVAKGMEIIRSHDARIEAQSSWLKNGILFIQKLDPKSIQRINCFRVNDRSHPAEWAVGHALVAGLGLRAVVDEAMLSRDEIEKSRVAGLLPSSVSKVQDQLLTLSNSLNMSKFEIRKEIAKHVSQLNAAMQTGMLILAPKERAARGSAEPATAAAPAENVYVRQFRDRVFYQHFVDTKSFHSDLDQFARAVLQWLAEDWEKTVGPVAPAPEGVVRLHADSKLVFLKVAFDGRQLFRARPLFTHLPLVQPSFRELLAESLAQRKKILDAMTVFAKELKKEQLLVLKRAHESLARVTEEFEKFLAELPKSAKEAERYYADFRFQLPDRLSPSPKKREPVATASGAAPSPIARRLGFLREIPLKFFALFFFLSFVLAYANWETLGPRLKFWRGARIGHDNGIIGREVRDNRWIGTMKASHWHNLRDQEKYKQGQDILQAVAADEFDGLELIDERGTHLASSIYVGDKLILRIEGLDLKALFPQGTEAGDLQGLRVK